MQEMNDTDKERILKFLNGNISVKEFETWIYNDLELEKRVGAELYYELIVINYNSKSILNDLGEVIIGNYVSLDDFDKWKYYKMLDGIKTEV